MKKIIFLTAAILAIILIYLGTCTSHAENKLITYKLDDSQKVSFNFTNARIRIMGWNKNYIGIKVDDSLQAANIAYSIKQENNQLILDGFQDTPKTKFIYKINTWFTLSQINQSQELSNSMESGIYDFDIKVPKNVPVEAVAEILKAYDCKLQAVDSPNAEIRECRLADNYIGKGKSAEVRETTIGDNAYFKNRILKVRECDAENITIGIEEQTEILEAEVREVNGNNLIMEAPDYKDLSLLVRDCGFDSFCVNSSKDSGSIWLRSSKIKNISNPSGIEIQTGDWNGWRY